MPKHSASTTRYLLEHYPSTYCDASVQEVLSDNPKAEFIDLKSQPRIAELLQNPDSIIFYRDGLELILVGEPGGRLAEHPVANIYHYLYMGGSQFAVWLDQIYPT
ncbi:MAG: hypothetical protein ABIG95_06640 [Candidatus Woesearchaeota archaeon]